jgi:hypothetical protein
MKTADFAPLCYIDQLYCVLTKNNLSHLFWALSHFTAICTKSCKNMPIYW